MDIKLKVIKESLENNDPTILAFYSIHNNLIFTCPTSRKQEWKLYIPKSVESSIIIDYHIRYRHMGPLKVVKALSEHVYIKGINKKVRQTVRKCTICQICLLYTSHCHYRSDRQTKQNNKTADARSRRLRTGALETCSK